MSSTKKVVTGVSRAEIVEKKSRFIASCRPVSDEEEALSLIAAERKRYFDARHTCFAYVCGENNEIMRFSDDGEPRGTAGKPILDVITGNNLKDALITVTRYFGGTLLGTGGLVRAYSSSAKAAVEEGINGQTILKTARGAVFRVCVAYKDVGKLEHLCASGGIQINSKEFAEEAAFTLQLKEEQFAAFEKDITDMTLGSAKLSRGHTEDLVFKI